MRQKTTVKEVSMRKKFSVSLERTFRRQVNVTSGYLDTPDWDLRAGAVNVRMVGIRSRETGSGWQ